MEEISVQTLKNRLEGHQSPDSGRSKFLVIDVREQPEWDLGHLQHASVVHIPMGQVPDHLAQLPKNEEILVLCRSGGRSAQITHFLTTQGFFAKNITGGLLAWQAQVEPTFPIC